MRRFLFSLLLTSVILSACKKDKDSQNVKKAIAFVVQKNNTTNLWYIGTDQSSMTTVSSDDLGTVWSNPTWSPDGRTIYFIRNTDQPGVNGIYSTKPNGIEFKPILIDTPGLTRHFYQLTSSLDNENIIFSLHIARAGRTVIEVYRMCPCGTQVSRLTQFETPQPGQTISTEAYGGSFAPGDSILSLVQSNPLTTGVKDVRIYQMNVKTKELKLLRTVKAADVAGTVPSYSPKLNGKMLLSIDGDIHTMNVDGSDLKPLNNLKGYHPMWDRNGKDFYFSSFGIASMQQGIYRADINLTEVKMISRSASLGTYGGFAVNPIE